eukprot:91170_1
MSQIPYRNDIEQKILSLTSDALPDVSDDTLIISITERLIALEKQLKTLNASVQKKNNQISLLTNHKNDLETVLYQHNDENGIEFLNKVEELQIENNNCKKQIAEMELFLADYGMEWAGYKYHQDADKIQTNEDTTRNAVNFSIHIMIQRIKELNSLINYQHITKDKHSNIYQFRSPPTISLIFYSNGIFLKNGPLRKYELLETKQFIRDILDGFFPSELQDEYPNGVKLEAVNCIDKECALNTICSNDAKYTGDNITPEALISKLPQKVIRDGSVVEFQSEFQIKTNKNTADVICVDTPIAKLLQSEGCLLTQNSTLNGIQISTLRIKSSNHNITLILKMNATDRLCIVYELVHKYLQTRK